jgi:hypothetical protein
LLQEFLIEAVSINSCYLEKASLLCNSCFIAFGFYLLDQLLEMDYAVEGSEEWNRCKSFSFHYSNSFSNLSSVEAAIGRWDRKFKRPIAQNNQVVNPSTGLYEEAVQEGTYSRPPCINFYVHNLQPEL